MTQKCFILLCGVSYSGKSTFTKERLAGFQILSTDKYILDMAMCHKISYSQAFPRHIKGAELSIKYAMANDKVSAVVDQTNLTIKSRARKLSYAGNRKKIAIYWPIPEPHILAERMAKRIDQVIKPEFVQDQILRYEIPTKEEGFDEVYLYSDFNRVLLGV